MASEMADSGQTSPLACYTCRRRKVKCDKILPQCSLCARVDAACTYPTTAEKPGPKSGAHHRKRPRREQLGVQDLTPATPIASIDYATEPPITSRKHAQQRRTQSSPPPRHLRTPSSLRDAAHSATTATTATQTPEGHVEFPASELPAFSRIMFPSHDAQTRPQSPDHEEITVESVCNGLGISASTYNTLMHAYFEHMTAFSLFLPNTIEEKFKSMSSIVEALALVASMFSFSARFVAPQKSNKRNSGGPPMPSYFSAAASKFMNGAFTKCGDATPSFWLLQASVLDVFYHLTRSVRSKSWRLLGICIRLAYDMKLHLIDIDMLRIPEMQRRVRAPDNAAFWSLLEEKRRCWWAIWEMDVYASTIRRLPTAIDWKQNFSLLPMPDECWFNHEYHESCFLAQDVNDRWKSLARTGNTSPRAWFIVINSLMHDVQLLVYNPGTSEPSNNESVQDALTTISNSLYCATASLPSELKYGGEMLDFRTKRSAAEANFRQFHSDIYAIHLMSQLTQFMVHHYKVCAQAPWVAGTRDGELNEAAKVFDQASWTNYMKAAEAIVAIVRNSNQNHFKCVNPFLNNTLWFAAAAQIACAVLDPSLHNRALVRSNYEVLAVTIDRFVEFWASMDMLRPRLGKIESALRQLAKRETARHVGHGHNTGEAPRQQQQQYGAQLHYYSTAIAGENDEMYGRNACPPAVEPGMLAFMPVFPDIEDASMLTQQSTLSSFEDIFSLGLDVI